MRRIEGQWRIRKLLRSRVDSSKGVKCEIGNHYRELLGFEALLRWGKSFHLVRGDDEWQSGAKSKWFNQYIRPMS